MSDARRAMSWALAFATLWAVVEIAAASALARYSPYQVVWTRYLVHLALLVVWFGWRTPRRLWVTRRPMTQLVRSSLMLIMPASWVLATQMGGAINAVMTVFWLCPLFVLACAHVLLRERASPSLWIASATVAAAGTLIFRGSGLPTGLELPLALSMSVSFSLYVAMTRLLRHETVTANLFYTAAGVFVLLSPVMPHVWITPGVNDMAVLALVGALGLATLFALDRMASAADVSRSAPFISFNLPVMVLTAAAAGSTPGRGALVGAGAIVAVAVWLWVSSPSVSIERAAPNV